MNNTVSPIIASHDQQYCITVSPIIVFLRNELFVDMCILIVFGPELGPNSQAQIQLNWSSLSTAISSWLNFELDLHNWEEKYIEPIVSPKILCKPSLDMVGPARKAQLAALRKLYGLEGS